MSQCALVRARVTDSSQHFTLSIIKCILSAGENILKGNSPCLGTSWWVSYTQVSPYISDQSPSKSSYFTLISASSSRIDSENIFDLFRLFCVFLHRSGINSFDFQYSFSSKIHLQFSFSQVVRVWHLGIVQTCLHPLWYNSQNFVNHLILANS